MKKILINGNFLCRNLTGIERFAWEVCRQLDLIITQDEEIYFLVPANAKNIPSYKNIHLIVSKKQIKSFPYWDLFYFSNECKKQKAVGLNFSNTAPFGRMCGVSFIHDIYAADYPKDFCSFKDKLIRLYSRINYWNIAKNARKVLTVSKFSKERIQNKYHVKENRISIIDNGWDHFLNVNEDKTIFTSFPILLNTEYYFTLGSLSKRKNLIWIAKYAKTHPQETFVVSGKAISGLVPDELIDLQKLSNVILVGYLSDAQVKVLMKNAKAFLFPSYYEGFGIPPLEALSVGTPIIISRAASLPEIFKNTAHYINPNEININLSTLLKEPVDNPTEVLNTYTYKNAGFELKKVLTQIQCK